MAVEHVPDWKGYSWTRLLRAVSIALDTRKIVLAIVGLLLLQSGWWAIDQAFGASFAVEVMPDATPPALPAGLSVEAVGSALVANARLAVEPARQLMAPFAAVFEIGTGTTRWFSALLMGLWGLVVGVVLGAAISRIAVMDAVLGDPVGILTALKFTLRRIKGLLGAPLIPLIGLAFFALPSLGIGALYRVADPNLVGWLGFIPLLVGVVMALVLLGLALSWPLMTTTIAVEGDDAFDALSRSYSYFFQRTARYGWYLAIVWASATVGLIVVGAFARLVVHLALWSQSFTAPDALLLTAYQVGSQSTEVAAAGSATAGFWLLLVGLITKGVVVSLFWSSMVLVYLMIRHDVDGTSWHDVCQGDHEPTESTFVPETTGEIPTSGPGSAANPTASEAAVSV